MNTDRHRLSLSLAKSWGSTARVWLGFLAMASAALLLAGCGTTWRGMLGGGLKGAQEHELRQRPLHGNSLN